MSFYMLNTALTLDQIYDLREILKRASQSAQHTHRERATAVTLITDIDSCLDESDIPPAWAKR